MTTKAHVERRIEYLNRLNGFAEHVPYSTPGCYLRAGAYGGHQLQQYANKFGGVHSITPGFGKLKIVDDAVTILINKVLADQKENDEHTAIKTKA